MTGKKKKRAGRRKLFWAAGAAALVVMAATVICLTHRKNDAAGGNSVLNGESSSGEKTPVTEVEGFCLLDEDEPCQGLTLRDERLTVEAIGTYDGAYMEDGTDEQVERVAAVLIKNESEHMLQIAELKLVFDSGDEAVFLLTNIPAGRTVLALDMNRLQCDKERKATEITGMMNFFDETPMETERLDAEGTEGRLTLKNRSDEAYPLVYVYYKTMADNGVYLGGITYRVPFEQIPGKTQIETDAAHYSPDKSEIVEIQILGEETINHENKVKEEEK